MRKRLIWRGGGLFLCLSAGILTHTRTLWAADAPVASYSALSDVLVDRARTEVERIQMLVEQGTLPRTRLDQAMATLADTEDEAILRHTLYGETRVQDMTPDQGKVMVEAAQRRVDRQTKIVEDRQKLLEQGILARSEFAPVQDELDMRKQALQLATNRARLLDDLRQMAATEQRLEQLAQAQKASAKEEMVRYNGNGLFNLNDLVTISNEFQKQFHHTLPVSALGQTIVHQALGLDHRNRVDIALNPNQPEGVWLRQFLERLRVPYLAFSAAVAGAATAPHIHIGPESTKLKLATR
jgi:hypothetical protein